MRPVHRTRLLAGFSSMPRRKALRRDLPRLLSFPSSIPPPRGIGDRPTAARDSQFTATRRPILHMSRPHSAANFHGYGTFLPLTTPAPCKKRPIQRTELPRHGLTARNLLSISTSQTVR